MGKQGDAFFSNQLKFYRLLFWAGYLVFLTISVLTEGEGPDYSSVIKTVGFFISLLASFLVLDLLILPDLFLRRRYFLLGISVVGILFFAVAAEWLLEWLFLGKHPFGHRFKLLENIMFLSPWLIFALCIFLAEARFRKAIEKTSTELEYLKQQINPHFLLNTHNNIFFLIRQDPALASSMLMKLSGILKYTLYESARDLVPLNREIDNLKNYIELESIRKNESLTIDVDLPCINGDLKVAPLILVTFVENAFKHVSNFRDKRNAIEISLSVTQTDLVFQVTNTVACGRELSNSGIGLKNLRKRLQLIYPKKHHLTIEQNDDIFSVQLTIKIK